MLRLGLLLVKTGEPDRAHVPRPSGRPVPAPEALLEPKFITPVSRPGTVERVALVERLTGGTATGVVTIVGPAGYGKTTLMAQWATHDPRPTAWLTVDRTDNDPAVFIRDLFDAVELGGMVSKGALASTRVVSDDAVTLGVSLLVRALGGTANRGLLMLDHTESLRSRGSRDVLAGLAFRLPPQIVLVVSSRAAPAVPSTHLRTQGLLHEFGPAELAMSEDEARAMFDTEGIEPGLTLGPIVARTEGWPVALYLIALAVKAGVSLEDAFAVGGDDRFIADYLRREVLRRMSPERADFLVRTSILDRLSGPLCDYVLQREGSARTLEKLEVANQLVVPLDRTRTWFRYHGILRDHLTADLDRMNPTVVHGLHRRAAEWFTDHGQIVAAVHHAQRANDHELAARLTVSGGRSTFASGEIDTFLEWLEWFERSGGIDCHPEVAILGFLGRALAGDAVNAERWAATIDRTAREGVRSTDSPLLSFVRAMRWEHGSASMLEDAIAAVEGLPPSNEWYPAALGYLGAARLWTGDTDEADLILERAIVAAGGTNAPPAASYALACRAAIAMDRGRTSEAESYATEAVSIVRSFHLDRTSTSCLPFIVAARCAAHRGDVPDARRLLTQASNLRPLLTTILPGISVHTLLEMATALVAVADITAARQVLREVNDIVIVHPDLGSLPARQRRLQEALARLPAGEVGASSLTTAELRLLPLLVTHLTFREIGERLYVSRHTVKTQAMSIYRKLAVSSRSEAVDRARELGLLNV